MLFTFPSRYCFTIGHQWYLALDGGPPSFNRNSSCSGLLGSRSNGVAYLSPTGLSPSAVRFPNTVRLDMRFVTPHTRCGRYQNDPSTPRRATTAVLHAYGLGSSPFAHHYSGNLIRFLFLRLLRCFTSPGSPRLKRVTGLLPAGFPHSGISGSMVAGASPKLFAACHALHRPLVPRHPPCALIYLNLFDLLHPLFSCQGPSCNWAYFSLLQEIYIYRQE